MMRCAHDTRTKLHFIENRKLSANVHRRVRNYYDFVWSSLRGDPHEVIDSVPAALRVDIMVELC